MNIVFQRDILNHVEDWSCEVSGRLLRETCVKLQNLCREPEDFADTFKCQRKCFILEQNLKKEKDVSSAETELEKSFKWGREGRRKITGDRPSQNGTSCKLQHL